LYNPMTGNIADKTSEKQRLFVSEKILIVDDDEEFRSEFRDCFEEFGIRDAKDGREALDILRRPNEIDLVILDLRMPGLGGMDVLKEIKRIDRNISVIIFTGYGTKETVLEAFREKVNDFIEKPINIEKTRKIMAKVLDSKKFGEDIDAKGVEGKLEKVKNFINRNIGKKLTLKDAAGIVFMSPKYFSRVFKQLEGEGFKEYVLRAKTEEEKGLLKDTRYSVEEISFKLGYENSESFIRIFQKRTGKTPSEYRVGDKKRGGKKKKR
jgi:two-component system, response regulator YesN